MLKHLPILFVLIMTVGTISPARGQVTSNPCLENYDFKVVILGSSTAAGTGPSHTDSAWVNRYRNALQSINPDNQVINLAVGGYTTYRIMPNNFVTPASRPAVDTLKNITKALSLHPDVIIVNLPSNDRNWPMGEQLANFDSLYRHSWNNGVPMYICTTQPITTSGTYQRNVRDSILSMFGSNAIEFFTPLATSNNTVDSTYAADAVHLNDLGHRILFSQVWNKDLLIDVLPPPMGTDINSVGIITPIQHCPDPSSSVGWILSNSGISSIVGNVGYGVYEINGQRDSVALVLSDTLHTCTVDTLWTSIPLDSVGNYTFTSHLGLPNDTILSNNTSNTPYYTVKLASLPSDSIQYVCSGDSIQLPQFGFTGDTLLWYTDSSGSHPISSSDQSFVFNSDSTFYRRAVSGNTAFTDALSPSTSHNISFNGNMFNLYSDTALTITQLQFTSATAGTVYYAIHTISGSYRGNENSSSLWTSTTQDTTLVTTIGDAIVVPLNIHMNAGDTMGVYVHMTLSSQSLYYQSSSAPFTKAGEHLSYISGSGIAFNFGAVYNNRIIEAKIDYEYGFNQLGECSSELRAYSIQSDTSSIHLPNTISILGDSVSVHPSFQQIQWVNLNSGDTLGNSSSIYLDSTSLATPITLYASGYSALGCYYSDTVNLTVINDISIAEQSTKHLLYPNPAAEEIHMEGTKSSDQITLYDVSGQLLWSGGASDNETSISIRELPNGYYVIRLHSSNQVYSYKLLVCH